MVKENHTEQWKKRRGCSRMKGEAGSGFPFGIMRLMVGVPNCPSQHAKMTSRHMFTLLPFSYLIKY